MQKLKTLSFGTKILSWLALGSLSLFIKPAKKVKKIDVIGAKIALKIMTKSLKRALFWPLESIY